MAAISSATVMARRQWNNRCKKKMTSTHSLISSKDILQKWISIKTFSDEQKLREVITNAQIYITRNAKETCLGWMEITPNETQIYRKKWRIK